MAQHRLYAFLVTALMCLGAVGCRRTSVIPIENHLKGAVWPDGKQWLAWQNSNREDYVMAYISGYSYGVKDACFLHDDLEPTVSLKHAVYCREKAPRYTYKQDNVGNPYLSAYTDVLTKFYTEHPEYQSIPYVRLMPYLTDEQHKTADDLYSMAKAGKFPTMGGSMGIDSIVPSE